MEKVHNLNTEEAHDKNELSSDNEDIFDEMPKIDNKDNIQINGNKPNQIFDKVSQSTIQSSSIKQPENILVKSDASLADGDSSSSDIQEEENEPNENDLETTDPEGKGDPNASLHLSDLTRSLIPKYFIQVVRISVNDFQLSENARDLNGRNAPYYNNGDNDSSRNNSGYIANTPSNKILYTIRSLKKSGRKDVFVVNRFHEDIEWLDHCLLTQNKALGLIIPPISSKPIESFFLTSYNVNNPQNAPEGDNDYNYIQADQSLTKSPYDNSILQHIHHSFNYDCFNLERYLTLLLQHPVFGSDITLKRFLTEKNAPQHGNFKKGFFGKFASVVSEMRKVNQAEFDEFFQHERFWNTEYSLLLRDTLQAFSKKVEAIYQLAQVSGHFSTALSMAHCNGPSIYLDFNQTLQNVGNLFENLKQKNEELQAYYQLTLGFELDFYCRYLDSHKDTLNRRNCLLLEYENNKKLYEKAKPNKKEMARQVKILAEKTLQECSDTAKKEFNRFHNDQSAQILRSIYNYANANLQKSKDIYEIISFSLNQLQASL
ncbi:unnamed protein product [Gordionus sp. m RMFG-2023]|uniref:sorting nexin-5-like n=1 Tax=Gordionus sp. m RMFG-2023 TaxID=3053472 RepID=UPI0030E1FD2D